MTRTQCFQIYILKRTLMLPYLALILLSVGCQQDSHVLERIQGLASVVVVGDENRNLSGWLIQFDNPNANDGIWFHVPSGVKSLTVTTDANELPLIAATAEWSSMSVTSTGTRIATTDNPSAGTWFLRYPTPITGKSTLAISMQLAQSTDIMAMLQPERLMYGTAYAGEIRHPWVYEHFSDIKDIATEAINVARAQSGKRLIQAAESLETLGAGLAVDFTADFIVKQYKRQWSCENSPIDYNKGLNRTQLVMVNIPGIKQMREVLICHLNLSVPHN